MTADKIIAFASIALVGLFVIRHFKAPIEGGDLSRQNTALVPVAPLTTLANTWGSGASWEMANVIAPSPYAPGFRWAPTSNGYGWNGGFQMVPNVSQLASGSP